MSDLLVKHSLCPDCGDGKLERKDGELCCTRCGFVIKSENFSMSIPFGFQSTPGNELALNSGMGGTLRRKGRFSLIARSQNSTIYQVKCSRCGCIVKVCPECGHPLEQNDWPLRACHTGIMEEKHEPPKIATLLRFGKLLSAQFGFDERKGKAGVIFSNTYGKKLRKMGSYIVDSNLRHPLKQIAEVCLIFTLFQLHPEKVEEAKAKIKPDDQIMRETAEILGFKESV